MELVLVFVSLRWNGVFEQLLDVEAIEFIVDANDVVESVDLFDDTVHASEEMCRLIRGGLLKVLWVNEVVVH